MLVLLFEAMHRSFESIDLNFGYFVSEKTGKFVY